MVVGHEAAEALRDAAQLKFHGRLLVLRRLCEYSGAASRAALPPGPRLGRAAIAARPSLDCRYTGLLVAGTILPLMISCLIVLISACRLAGTLLAKSWYGASVTPPLASVPT